ncbi:hypothetical protein D034_4759 [Vibrio parahaemolyticus Peru-288]|nr:hypothetical protein D034_4759 [Vibrio parahaemolyticus Peru-288]
MRKLSESPSHFLQSSRMRKLVQSVLFAHFFSCAVASGNV